MAALLIVPLSTKRDISLSDNISGISTEDRLEEAKGLALAIDLDLKECLSLSLDKIRPATLIGKGKLEELKTRINSLDVELVIIDHPLSPGQQRNLERAWDVKILDRTGLILEIFGRRAATREGRLQVDLAHLNYQKSRLVRSWTHLERQRGGAGFMGGPGETQLEADKRQLQSRIISLTKELERVRKTRELHRKKRRKVPYPVIALVGYTNAGKSTLFNRLTGAKVLAKDQLFATLDPTMRAIELPNGTKAILSDTVGFISNLPTQLIAAFRATLEEVLEADIILHVEDVANPNRKQHRKDVQIILKQLGVNQGQKSQQTPIITIWNKIDCLDQVDPELGELSDNIHEKTEDLSHIDNERPGGYEPLSHSEEKPDADRKCQLEDLKNGQLQDAPLRLSAKTGEGVEDLLATLEDFLKKDEITLDLQLTPDQGAILNWLYQNAAVTQVKTEENGVIHLQVDLPGHLSGRLNKMLNEAR